MAGPFRSRSVIHITPHIAVDENEIHLQFLRASGPGGQNVNKLASAVRLSFDVRASASLPETVRARLLALAGRRVSAGGILQIEARRQRTQEGNRREAIERLVQLLRRAAVPREMRRPTRPTAASRLRRLATKRRRADTKQARSRPKAPDDQA